MSEKKTLKILKTQNSKNNMTMSKKTPKGPKRLKNVKLGLEKFLSMFSKSFRQKSLKVWRIQRIVRVI